MAGWGNPTDIEFSYNLAWAHHRVAVASVSSGAIAMKNPAWTNGLNTGPSYIHITDIPLWIENAYELLTVPGSMYLNRTTNTVYYIPRVGENMATAQAIAPLLTQLLTFNGVSNLTLQGLTFAHTSWNDAGGIYGFINVQANVNLSTGQRAFSAYTGSSDSNGSVWDNPIVPDALSFYQCAGITLEKCVFKHLGGSAVLLCEGTKNSLVRGCTFQDISGAGVDISTPHEYNTLGTAYQTNNNRVTNNVFSSCGVEYTCCPCVVAPFASNLEIDHNHAYNHGYVPIHIGWGWTVALQATNPRSNYYVHDNDIHDHMQALQDGGGIYCNSVIPGLRVARNTIHSQIWATPQNYPPGGIYLDDGSNNELVQNNCVFNIIGGGMFRENDNVAGNELSFNFVDRVGSGTGNSPRNVSAGGVTTAANLFKINVQLTTMPPSLLNNAGLQAAYGGYAPNPATQPCVPTNLAVGAVSGYTVPLTWTAPNAGAYTIAGYEIWLNGSLLVGVVSGSTAYTYQDLQPSTAYSFTVRAFDVNGNVSRDSLPVTFTTSSGLTPRSDYGTGFIA